MYKSLLRPFGGDMRLVLNFNILNGFHCRVPFLTTNETKPIFKRIIQNIICTVWFRALNKF